MKHLVRAFVGLLTLCVTLGIPWILFQDADQPTEGIAEARLASPGRLAALYKTWRGRHEALGGDRNLVLALGWSRDLAPAHGSARGLVKLDLVGGSASATVEGLAADEDWDLWLVDNQEGEGRSARPEPGDRMHRVGSFRRNGSTASLSAALSPQLLRGFEVDVAAVTPAGATPDRRSVLSGAPSFFQRYYTWTSRQPTTQPSDRLSFGFDSLLGSRTVFASTGFNSLDSLVAKGADLFFNEQFGGNGRTCGSCHPAENNFTIDPKFIASLRPDDPLFVAETNPDLARNFEKPELMRGLGLILENVDGFDDLENKFVMRGVPHLLGLSRYLIPGNQPVPPLQRTGWGGDGAPGGGTLREFATGAVTQHFTKTLGRVPGVDFRLPTDQELDAIEAFSLAIGRQDNPDIDAIRFRDPVVAFGRDAFQGRGVASFCFVCHANAGANTGGGTNNNFDIGVGRLPNHPGEIILPGSLPPDGGFGRDPVFDSTTGDFLGFGLDGQVLFNSQPAIESVDTPPFFHNNGVQTIEAAVAFYNSQAFKDSTAGASFPIRMEPTEVEAIAAMLRVLNALENIRSATELAHMAIAETRSKAAKRLAQLASFDSEDGVEVLEERRLHSSSAAKLNRAFVKQRAAALANTRARRNAFLRGSIQLLAAAKAEMVDEES